jgi:hypothetical protein
MSSTLIDRMQCRIKTPLEEQAGRGLLKTRLDAYYRVMALCELFRIGVSIRQRPERAAAWTSAITHVLTWPTRELVWTLVLDGTYEAHANAIIARAIVRQAMDWNPRDLRAQASDD